MRIWVKTVPAGCGNLPGAATNIDEPKNLEKIITTIDGLDWYSAREEGLGNLYEGLLERTPTRKSPVRASILPRVS